ncbi:MAG: transporter substrate-binding domain-containing protein, partial [Clostridia bacterium]|nr:transporter substrate-binding domain-containing protein [Clostridia bacterium]
MYPKNRRYAKREKAIALLMSVITLLFLLTPFGAAAKSGSRVVRVGWYESYYNRTDELGRRSGYAYEYQQKIAAYTGWTYEYVEGSWPDLFQMLLDGRIDLLSDVSYTEERAKTLLYSAFPMGTEEYFVFVRPGNTEITTENLSAINGKKAGVNKGSVQADMFRDWARANNVTPEIVELTATHEESMKMLKDGRIDLYISLENMVEAASAVPLFKIGASDFYFAVSGGNEELASELNAAMNRINNENPFYNQQLTLKYLVNTGSNHFLEADELSWLQTHGKIKVGYQDNYLAFCAKDPKTGELTGALKDYLRVAEDCLENAHIDFEAIAYPTAEAAIEAMKRGDVDCVFPANLTAYDGETQGLLITGKLMATDMAAVIRQDEVDTFLKKERVSVAVNAGNPNYDMFLLDHFPTWRAIYYDTTADGLKAISEGSVDCLLISNYRFNNIARLCRKYNLTTISTGVALDYCFAVRREDTKLYSILGKITDLVPESTVNSALSFYFTEDAKTGIGDVLLQNLGLVIAVPALLIILLFFLLWRNARAEQKAKDANKLVSATEFDELTGLYDKNYFYEYADRMYRDHPDMKMDAVVLDIERFHSVNAINGRDFGDMVLRKLADEIRAFLIEDFGIASRSDADHFAIYCDGPVDFKALLSRLQASIDSVNSNTSIRLRMGAMRWQEHTEPAKLIDMARVACGLARRNSGDLLVVY